MSNGNVVEEACWRLRAQVSDLENAFAIWLQSQNPDIPDWYEYQFHPTRKWRFRLCLAGPLRWPYEIEGITDFGKDIGRHQGNDGFLKDAEKYEAATASGGRSTGCRGLGWLRARG